MRAVKDSKLRAEWENIKRTLRLLYYLRWLYSMGATSLSPFLCKQPVRQFGEWEQEEQCYFSLCLGLEVGGYWCSFCAISNTGFRSLATKTSHPLQNSVRSSGGPGSEFEVSGAANQGRLKGLSLFSLPSRVYGLRLRWTYHPVRVSTRDSGDHIGGLL